MAALQGKELPAVAPVAKGEDEGVYEYFKANGVFALLKVRTSVRPSRYALCAVLQTVHTCASRLSD